MADLQRLMTIVRQLEEQGVDVADFLERQAPMPMPMPEFQPFTGPGPGAIVDDMRMPEFKPFTGPGPGAYVTDRDNEIILKRMMRDRMNRQAPMTGLLQMIGGQ